MLTPAQKHLVSVLGKRSGFEEGYSKRDACRELGFDWVRGGMFIGHDRGGNDDDVPTTLGSNLDLLPGCASYIRLQYLSRIDAGDHEVVLCQVTLTGVWNGETVLACDEGLATGPLDSSNVLYTGLLRAEGII